MINSDFHESSLHNLDCFSIEPYLHHCTTEGVDTLINLDQSHAGLEHLLALARKQLMLSHSCVSHGSIYSFKGNQHVQNDHMGQHFSN